MSSNVKLILQRGCRAYVPYLQMEYRRGQNEAYTYEGCGL